MQRLKAAADPMPIDRFIARQLDDHIAVVHRYLARRVGAQTAEDVTADVMCSAIAGAHTYDPTRGPVVAWLMGIATHALSRHWRAERQQLEALDRLGVDPLHRVTVASPEHHAAESDEMRAVARVLRRLPEGEREALLLYAWADLRYADVAAALDVPIGTVRSRIARARQRLRAELDLTDPVPADAMASRDRSTLIGGDDD